MCYSNFQIRDVQYHRWGIISRILALFGKYRISVILRQYPDILYDIFDQIALSELGPVLLKFALFNGLRPLVKNVIFCSVSAAH